MVGAGAAEVVDAGFDGGLVAPGDDGVDEAVVQVLKLVLGEAHPAEAGGVSRESGEEAQRAAADLAGAGRVGLQDDQLLDGEGGRGRESAGRGRRTRW